MAHDVHPKKIIKTEKGNIVMEMPDLMRSSALSNSIYTYVLTDADLLKINEMKTDDERNQYIKMQSLKKGYTVMELTMLAYVTSAPFHLNDYGTETLLDLKSFLEFADMDLLNKMMSAMKEIGVIDPLSP